MIKGKKLELNCYKIRGEGKRILTAQWTGTLKMNHFVKIPRHLNSLKSKEWANDQSYHFGCGKKNAREKSVTLVWAGDKTGLDVGHLSIGTESCKRCLSSSYRIIALEAVIRYCKSREK